MVQTSGSEDQLLSKLIAGAIAEVDVVQVAITRRLTPAQRFQQMTSMIDFVEDVAAYRLRQRSPHLSEVEALRIVRSGSGER